MIIDQSLLMLIINIIQEYILILRHKVFSLFSTIPENYNKGDAGNVLMIVGFNGPWGSLKTISDRLNKQGYKIHFPKFKTRDPILKIVDEISQFINDYQLENIIIVVHSKGGIVARNLLNIDYSNINKIINIAVPNNGTIFGYLNIHNLHELKPKSSQLKALDDAKTDKIINIYPKFDNHVIPNSSLYLKGANNVEIDIVGHTRLLESKETLNVIEKIL